MEELFIIEGNGRKRRAELYNCETCDKEFLRRKQASKGNPQKRFCSKRCFSDSNRNRVEIKCFNCGEMFERTLSKLKSSKSELYFCSRKCKDFAQSIEGDCQAIQPDHYGTGTGVGSYRKRALRASKVNGCKCGFKFEGLLIVHHIDGDRCNNEIKNLEILCPICHGIRHMKKIENKWAQSTSSLTPREKIKEIEKEVFGT